MKQTTSQSIDLLREVLAHPARGIAGLVEELLLVCARHDLELDWRPECLRVRSRGGDWEELSGTSVRPSVFRAILARVAVLCNEFKHSDFEPEPVSPYGVDGDCLATLAISAPDSMACLLDGSNSARSSAGVESPIEFNIQFSNTPARQSLKLWRRDSMPIHGN